jgi:hypothetical protein
VAALAFRHDVRCPMSLYITEDVEAAREFICRSGLYRTNHYLRRTRDTGAPALTDLIDCITH